MLDVLKSYLPCSELRSVVVYGSVEGKTLTPESSKPKPPPRIGMKLHIAGNGSPSRSNTYAATIIPPPKYSAPTWLSLQTIHPFPKAATK